MQQRPLRYFVLILCAAGTLGSVWFAAEFILPWTAPFILAYSLAALMEPLVRFLLRRGLHRRTAAAIMTVGILALIFWAAGALTVKCAAAITDFARRGPELMAELDRRLDALLLIAAEYMSAAPEGVSAYLSQSLDALMRELYSVPAVLSQRLLDVLARIAQSGPDTLLFTVTAALGTYLISSAYPRTNAFISAQLPEELRRRLDGLGTDLRSSLGGYLRSQLILMAITFSELLAAFFALRIENFVGAAAVTALVDALPVFGTGTVLLPWAVYELLLGDSGRAVLLAALWGGVNLVRSCVQAKLLGDQIGLAPLPSLLAIYVGWRIWHVWGMLLFPILLATLAQLNEKGIIKLWKEI